MEPTESPKEEESKIEEITSPFSDMQLLEEAVLNNPGDAIEILHSALSSLEDPECALFARILLHRTNGALNALSDVITSVCARPTFSLSSNETLMFAFAILQLSCDVEDEKIQKILTLNHHTLKSLFGNDLPPCLLSHEVQRRPPPPRPIGRAPARSASLNHQLKLPRRPLPGYTPGWMAAEYAKKVNL